GDVGHHFRHGETRHVEHLGHLPLRPPPFPQTEPVHDTAHMVGIVADVEARTYGFGESQGSPTVGVESGCARACPIDFGDTRKLFRRKTAGTARSTPFAQRLNTS